MNRSKFISLFHIKIFLMIILLHYYIFFIYNLNLIIEFDETWKTEHTTILLHINHKEKDLRPLDFVLLPQEKLVVLYFDQLREMFDFSFKTKIIPVPFSPFTIKWNWGRNFPDQTIQVEEDNKSINKSEQNQTF